MLEKDFDFAFDDSFVENFGQDFVDACPAMKDKEDEIVRRKTLTNRWVHRNILLW